MLHLLTVASHLPRQQFFISASLHGCPPRYSSFFRLIYTEVYTWEFREQSTYVCPSQAFLSHPHFQSFNPVRLILEKLPECLQPSEEKKWLFLSRSQRNVGFLLHILKYFVPCRPSKVIKGVLLKKGPRVRCLLLWSSAHKLQDLWVQLVVIQELSLKVTPGSILPSFHNQITLDWTLDV